MPRKKSEAEIIEKLKEAKPEIEYVGGYVSATQKMELRCSICGHIWKATPKNIFNAGSGCPECSRKAGADKHRHTHESFEIAVKAKYPHIELVSEYKGYKEQISYRCTKCGRTGRCQAVTLLSGRASEHEHGCGTKYFPEMSDKQLISDFNSGMKYSEIAEKYGCTKRTVDYRLAALGLSRYERRPKEQE